jgi:hypothetical protein
MRQLRRGESGGLHTEENKEQTTGKDQRSRNRKFRITFTAKKE